MHTNIHSHKNTLVLYTQAHLNSVLSCDKQTHQGPSKRAFNFGQMAYHSFHPSASLWVWDTDAGSAYCAQKHIFKPIHTKLA